MKSCKFPAVFLLLLAAMVMFFPITALAAGDIDFSCARSLTVVAVYDGKAISGMQFDAYLIATVDEYGNLTVTEDYEDYGDDFNSGDKSDEQWQSMAQNLAQKIMLDDTLTPSYSSVTDENGAAAFPDIPMGLYLIMGSSMEKDGYVYATSPFFAMVPEQDLTTNTWNYHVTAHAKLAKSPLLVDFEVIKIWKDDCHKQQRPQSITITLICDAEAYDTVTLPYNGAWSYTWENLEANHQWTVTEEKAEGYLPGVIQREGNTFLVTNTCDKPTPPDPDIPQTGQLWWPVPVLIAAGMLFVVIGLFYRRGTGNEK
ncbi:MAG: Cna B-type domain-containing protein [Faecousia sp.]